MMLDVGFCGFCVMMPRLRMMRMGEMGMMASLLVISVLMMLCRFMMVLGGVFMVLRSVNMMFGGFLGMWHVILPAHLSAATACASA
jgi:hypothetical protein